MNICIITPFIYIPHHSSQGTSIYIPLQNNLAKYFIFLIFTYEKTRNQKSLETAQEYLINSRTGLSTQIFFVLKPVPLLMSLYSGSRRSPGCVNFIHLFSRHLLGCLPTAFMSQYCGEILVPPPAVPWGLGWACSCFMAYKTGLLSWHQ